MKEQDVIEYKTLIQRNRHINKLRSLGFVIIPKKPLKWLGYSLIALGILTIPIPGTTPALIAAGLLSLGISKYHVIKKVTHDIFMFKYKRKW